MPRLNFKWRSSYIVHFSLNKVFKFRHL